MLKTMKEAERDACLQVADLMVTAAKTAPKGSGKDTVEACIVTGKEKDQYTLLTGSKEKTARSLGVAIIDEKEFKQMLENI